MSLADKWKKPSKKNKAQELSEKIIKEQRKSFEIQKKALDILTKPLKPMMTKPITNIKAKLKRDLRKYIEALAYGHKQWTVYGFNSAADMKSKIHEIIDQL